MAIAIFTHKILSGLVEPVQWLRYVDATTFERGEVLVWNAGSVQAGGADPTEIVGVALQGTATAPGYDAANSPATITGREQKVSVSRPNGATIYAANLTNNSSTLVTPAQADVGAQYGLTEYSNKWTVDKNKTAASARVEVVGFDTSIYGGIVFFRFLAAHLSQQ